MRLYVFSLIVFYQALSQEKPIKTFFSQENNSHYTFFNEQIIKKELFQIQAKQLNSTPLQRAIQIMTPFGIKTSSTY